MNRVLSTTHVLNEPLTIAPDELVTLQESDSLIALAAYAQEALVYDDAASYRGIPGLREINDLAAYMQLPREVKFNKFSKAYTVPQILVHVSLREVIEAAAREVKKIFGQPLVVTDALRSMEGGVDLYANATAEDKQNGLIAPPGFSAHNKAMAFDIHIANNDFGTQFDDARPEAMEWNGRNYQGDKISAQAKQNRITLEALFLKVAFDHEVLLAPLRAEWWDFRPPEHRQDLWRVIESAARVIGDEPVRQTAAAHIEHKNDPGFAHYAAFLAEWKKLFSGKEEALQVAIGHDTPPQEERTHFYTGNYNPIYNADLPDNKKQIT